MSEIVTTSKVSFIDFIRPYYRKLCNNIVALGKFCSVKIIGTHLKEQ